MDWYKAYDCIPQELLIAKLECCGIDNRSLQLLLGYFTNGKQRSEISLSFSSWHGINKNKNQYLVFLFLIFSEMIFFL